MFSKFVVSAIACAAVAGTAAAQIEMNGGFENGTGPDADFWTEFAGGGNGSFAERSSAAPLAGGWSLELGAIGADGAGGPFAGANYNSISDGGLASLQENTMVTLSFDADFSAGVGGVGFYVLRVLNGSGAIVADTGLQNLGTGLNSYSISANVPSFGAAPNDTYAAFVEFVVNAGAFTGSDAFATIDNVSIQGTLVPTPAVAGLLGMGGLVAMRRRR